MIKPSPSKFAAWLNETALACGAVSVAAVPMDHPLLKRAIAKNNDFYENWLAVGLHGNLDYLERMYPERANPWTTFPTARTALIITFSNRWNDPAATHAFPEVSDHALVGYISAYAREMDYHTRGQQILRALQLELEPYLGKQISSQPCVDTSPVYERLFAGIGGLGIRGPNDLLRTPERNVQVFIGCLFIDQALPPVIQQPKFSFACEKCKSCLKRCPTKAITEGHPFDARKCISQLTIEKRGVLTREEGDLIEDWLFGCDYCTTSCPPRSKLDNRIPVDLEWLLKSPSSTIRAAINGTSIAYAGVTQLRKNAVVLLKKNPTPRAKTLLKWVRAHTGSANVIQQLNA